MEARIVEESSVKLTKKLIEHEKGEDFLHLFQSLMTLPLEMMKEALYYISDRGDWGEGAEVVDVYFVNPLQKESPDALFLGCIRSTFLPKNESNIHLSEATRATWSENLNETVKAVYDFNWTEKLKCVEPVEMPLSAEMDYFDFERAIRAEVKEKFIEFFEHTHYEGRYHKVKDCEVKRGKVLLFLVGDGKYQAVPFIQSLFEPEDTKPLSKRVLEEGSIYHPETVGKHI